MRVDIYAETNSKALKASDRWCMYLIACETSKGLATIGDYVRTSGTYNGAILETINRALSRLKTGSEAHLHTANKAILDMIEYQLDDMAERGFHRKDGEPVKNRLEWESYWKLTRNILIIPEPGNHTFASWMSRELFKHETALAKEADSLKQEA